VNQQWSSKPFIYEINTRVWLTSLSQRYGYHINLYNVPDEVIDDLASFGMDAVWLMGIWTRGAASYRSALNYVHEYRGALPDISEIDIAGSAYAIHNYQVEPLIGGREGLSVLRWRLGERGLRLILDFVPNHVSTDHWWTREHPEYFVHSTPDAIKKHPGMFFPIEDENGVRHTIAHGRDPYFPSWIDTAQLNVFNPDSRRALRDTLLDIASQCDGVRCDMAMLMLNMVFEDTWGQYIKETPPAVDYWVEMIGAVRQWHPNFLFMAEVYWGLENILLEQGFDLTYDKVLYDRLFENNASHMRQHLTAQVDYQRRLVRFIENHDEARAASAFGIERSKVGAALISTVPGAVLLHDGQFTGRKVKLPVQIARQPNEPENLELEAFYRRLLAETRHPIYHEGDWELLKTDRDRLLAYQWQYGDTRRLIVLNLSPKTVEDHLTLADWNPALPLSGVLKDEMRRLEDSWRITLRLEGFGIAIYQQDAQLHYEGVRSHEVV
jgi:glycosidase